MRRKLITTKAAASVLLALMSKASFAAYAIDFQEPHTEIARQIVSLHGMLLVVCLVIFFAVFGVMFYSIIKHRKSKGHAAANFHESTSVEIAWTIIPFLILVGMAMPATRTVLAMKDTKSEDMTIKVTGYQWKWGYDYLQEGIQFYSTLITPRAQIEDYDGKSAAKGVNYLLEVDNPVVVPINKKVRILTTANDVIHSWWVPSFGVKQDAIPGLIRDTWFKVDTPGIYRGQCAELCGKDHGFMPIVVEAKTQEDYDKWVDAKKKEIAAQQDDPNKVWNRDELIARGEKVYSSNCVACHQANGKGVPGTFPSLDGSPVATGPKQGHLHIVLNGKKAMPTWAHLSDTEIAAVVTYERNAWGNKTGDMIQPADVKAARGQ